MIASAPYYWVVCDLCGRSAQDGSDITAWADEAAALAAADDDWWHLGEDGHFCSDHMAWCDDCDMPMVQPHDHSATRGDTPESTEGAS